MKEIDNISYFVSFCIEQYKIYTGESGEAVAERFFNEGVPDYLVQNYKVLHTQSRQWLMEEIDEFLTQKHNTK